MFSPRRVLVVLAMLSGTLLVLPLSSAQQEESKGEKIKFVTVDGVEIKGRFYGGNKRNAPTVMMLHALGQDSRKAGWIALAETLNKEGFSVLTFDFRGHGGEDGSTTLADSSLFWKIPRNAGSVKGAPKKEKIEFTDMSQAYYPILVNDIAAAKAFLDNRNDAGACNTSSLVVLGAEDGATLGALWLNAEWHRFTFTPANPLMGIPAAVGKSSEGKDIIAAVWLTPSYKLGSRTISLSALVDAPARQYATPMVFMSSDEDANAKKTLALVKAIKGTKKDSKYAFTDAVPIPGGGKLKGAGLLQKSLGTDESIVGYIKNVAESKGNEWTQHDFQKTLYVWRLPGQPPYPCKLLNEKLLLFDPYERFLPR